MIDYCKVCGKVECVCHTISTISLAHKLRNTALTTNKETEKTNAKSAYDFFVQRAKEEAEKGNFKLRYTLPQIIWPIKELKEAAKLLEIDGFKCKIDNEIVAWYSNTDCDSEDYIEISWE